MHDNHVPMMLIGEKVSNISRALQSPDFLKRHYFVVTENNSQEYVLRVVSKICGGGNSVSRNSKKLEEAEPLAQLLRALGENREEFNKETLEKAIDEYILSGGDLNEKLLNVRLKADRYVHYNPLQYAVLKQMDGVVETLLSKEANPNVCLSEGDEETVRNSVPLIIAINKENKKAVSKLLQYQADPNYKDAVKVAKKKNNSEILELIENALTLQNNFRELKT